MAKKRPRVLGTPGKQHDWPVNLIQFGACEVEGCTEDHGAPDGSDGWGYTTTLWARHRVPDLWMAAATEDGDAPALDFQLVGWILQRLAEGVAARKYHTGKSVAFSNTSPQIVCRLGEPVPRDELEAYGTHPDAQVIPVTWVPLSSAHRHNRAITIGYRKGAAVVHVIHSDARIDESDSGFILEYEDAPAPWEFTQDDFGVICTNCLIDDQPEVGRGLDLARRFGTAELVDGEWVAEDDERDET